MGKKEQKEQKKQDETEINSKLKNVYVIKTKNKPPEVIDRTELTNSYIDHKIKETREGIVFKVNRDSIRDLTLMRERKKAQEMEQKLMPLLKEISEKIYEYDFDVPLQVKLNAIGKDIDKLKARYFEMKAPLTLTSFN